jgi:dimethylamine/trimethylamine dehydrogenase
MTAETVTQEYLDTLLLYFEEEVMGEAHFYGLADLFSEEHQKQKLRLLAQVERCAAEAVRPLLAKHNLTPRPDPVLHAIGREDIGKSASMGWRGYVADMVQRFPKYMPEFQSLEAMAPTRDLDALRVLTAHEVAAIEFANLEHAHDPKSTQPLENYLTSFGKI